MLEDKLQEGKFKLQDGIRKHIFDWIAAIILVALIATSLDVFGLIDFRKISVIEFFISWFPYFVAAMLLQTDLYKKGIFVGKATDKFKTVIRSYSELANSLSGKQINGLYEFCDKYNDTARQSMQKQILRKEGLAFDDFDIGATKSVDDVDVVETPLKIRTKSVLKQQGFTKRQIQSIYAAKRVKIKGINVNVLLSSNDAVDVTNIGSDEKELQVRQIFTSAIKYLFTTFLLSLIAIKHVENWGWIGLVLIIFKVAYLFAGSYMSYFKGYDNVTIDLITHFTRKMDILKMYLTTTSDNSNNV